MHQPDRNFSWFPRERDQEAKLLPWNNHSQGTLLVPSFRYILVLLTSSLVNLNIFGARDGVTSSSFILKCLSNELNMFFTSWAV